MGEKNSQWWLHYKDDIVADPLLWCFSFWVVKTWMHRSQIRLITKCHCASVELSWVCPLLFLSVHQILSHSVNTVLAAASKMFIYDLVSHACQKITPSWSKSVKGTCSSIVHVCIHCVSMASQFIWNVRHENCRHWPSFQNVILCQLATLSF